MNPVPWRSRSDRACRLPVLMLAPRTVVVVNPKSQGGRLASRWTEGAETLGRAFPFDEVVNGFFEDGVAIAPEASLGVIPYGTGGDFRRTLALPTHLEDAARVIRDNQRKR